MDKPYWINRPSKPLFPDLLWSRPENKRQAGKLLIVGGNAHGFAAAGEAYADAGEAGIGTARVLLPDSLQKTVGKIFEAGEYAPSTPSGSFSRRALAPLIDMAGSGPTAYCWPATWAATPRPPWCWNSSRTSMPASSRSPRTRPIIS